MKLVNSIYIVIMLSIHTNISCDENINNEKNTTQSKQSGPIFSQDPILNIPAAIAWIIHKVQYPFQKKADATDDTQTTNLDQVYQENFERMSQKIDILNQTITKDTRIFEDFTRVEDIHRDALILEKNIKTLWKEYQDTIISHKRQVIEAYNNEEKKHELSRHTSSIDRYLHTQTEFDEKVRKPYKTNLKKLREQEKILIALFQNNMEKYNHMMHNFKEVLNKAACIKLKETQRYLHELEVTSEKTFFDPLPNRPHHETHQYKVSFWNITQLCTHGSSQDYTYADCKQMKFSSCLDKNGKITAQCKNSLSSKVLIDCIQYIGKLIAIEDIPDGKIKRIHDFDCIKIGKDLRCRIIDKHADETTNKSDRP